MCADPGLSRARSTCCGSYSNRDLSGVDWADVLSEYRGERLTFDQNEDRCFEWGRSICDPARIGPFSMWRGHCLHRQSCRDVAGSTAHLTATAWHWSNAACAIKVQIDPDGLIAILHAPAETTRNRSHRNLPPHCLCRYCRGW